MTTDKDKLLKYPLKELTYEIIGIMYRVYNNLGYGFQEKYYQRGIAEELKLKNYSYEKEKVLPIKYNNKIIGRYFIDFIINNVLGGVKIKRLIN